MTIVFNFSFDICYYPQSVHKFVVTKNNGELVALVLFKQKQKIYLLKINCCLGSFDLITGMSCIYNYVMCWLCVLWIWTVTPLCWSLVLLLYVYLYWVAFTFCTVDLYSNTVMCWPSELLLFTFTLCVLFTSCTCYCVHSPRDVLTSCVVDFYCRSVFVVLCIIFVHQPWPHRWYNG